VILTHDGFAFPKNDPQNLAARAMVARNNKADLYVSIHNNSSTNAKKRGASVYVTHRTELKKYKEDMTILGNKILDEITKIGIQKEGLYNNVLCKDTIPKYQYYDGSQGDYYADIRHAMKGDSEDYGDDFSDGSGIPTVLIEHAYMSNSQDVAYLDSDEDLKKLGEADAKAIVDFYNLQLKQDVVNSITINKTSANMLVGDKVKVTATASPSTAKNKTLRWTSSNTKVATVDPSGNITAVGTGNAKITVKSEGNPNISKTIEVKVEKIEVKFNKDTENILVGETEKLDVTISPTWTQNRTILWESSNKDIVEVTNQGKITAKKQGTATITVTWKEKNLSDTITVNTVKLADNTKIEIKKYTKKDNQLTGIGPNIKKADFLSNIVISDNLIAELKTVSEGQEYIGTNTKLVIKEKQYGFIIEEYDCLIYADVNGDGKISSMDYTLIKNHIMDVKKITDTKQTSVADVSGDGKISSMDYTLIKNHIMDVKKITVK